MHEESCDQGWVCFLQVYFQVDSRVEKREGEPFTLLVECGEREEVGVAVRVGFHSHYGEPPLDLPLVVQRGNGECVSVAIGEEVKDLPLSFSISAGHVMVSLEYNPFTQEWGVTRSDHPEGSMQGLTKQLQAAKV